MLNQTIYFTHPLSLSSIGPKEVGVVTVASITSSSLVVNWLQQQTANGIITHYEIIATPISTVGLDSPIEAIQSSLLYIEVCIFQTCTLNSTSNWHSGYYLSIYLFFIHELLFLFFPIVSYSRTYNRDCRSRTCFKLFHCDSGLYWSWIWNGTSYLCIHFRRQYVD